MSRALRAGPRALINSARNTQKAAAHNAVLIVEMRSLGKKKTRWSPRDSARNAQKAAAQNALLLLLSVSRVLLFCVCSLPRVLLLSVVVAVVVAVALVVVVLVLDVAAAAAVVVVVEAAAHHWLKRQTSK